MPQSPISKRVSPGRAMLIVFLVLTCWRVWFGPADVLPTAAAQIPDSGLQRKLLIEEVRKTNQLLTTLGQTITSHVFKVRVMGTDNKADKAQPRKPG